MAANITTPEDFMINQGKCFLFKDQKIDPDLVKQFGQLTGDWNEHNEKSTGQFQEPGVQGFLSLALFGGYHKEICEIPGSDPMNVEFPCKLLKKIPVGSTFTAALSVKDIKERPKYISAKWTYGLWDNTEKFLLDAYVVIRYTKK
jgi:hypothetical protein